jgi:hypothetical protein
LAEESGGANTCLFVEFAERGCEWVFTFVEATLWHLPPVALALCFARCIGALADPHKAGAIDEHDADAWAVIELVGVDGGLLLGHRCGPGR